MAEKQNYFAHETAVVDQDSHIGNETMIWHFSHVMEGSKIGTKCILGQNVFVGGKAIIGNNVKIQNNVSIYDAVVIEDDVFCGPSCVFTNVINPRAFVERKEEFKITLVKKGVSIGANATVICGVTIGEYAMIGAGAVVTKNVKPFALMLGVPAIQKGWVSKTGAVLGSELTCPETGEKYRVVNDQLERD